MAVIHRRKEKREKTRRGYTSRRRRENSGEQKELITVQVVNVW